MRQCECPKLVRVMLLVARRVEHETLARSHHALNAVKLVRIGPIQRNWGKSLLHTQFHIDCHLLFGLISERKSVNNNGVFILHVLSELHPNTHIVYQETRDGQLVQAKTHDVLLILELQAVHRDAQMKGPLLHTPWLRKSQEHQFTKIPLSTDVHPTNKHWTDLLGFNCLSNLVNDEFNFNHVVLVYLQCSIEQNTKLSVNLVSFNLFPSNPCHRLV